MAAPARCGRGPDPRLHCRPRLRCPLGDDPSHAGDDDALLEIFATRFNRPHATAEEGRTDFLKAIRAECVVGESVRLPLLSFSSQGEPEWVAFLAAMVDAAFRMIDDDAAGHNYFTR